MKHERFDENTRRHVLFLNRRDRLAVYISILEAIREVMREGSFAKFTHVMYKANLSAVRLKQRLLELSYIELVEWNEHGVKLTEKGVNFLKEVRKLFRVLEEYGVMLDGRGRRYRTLF